MLFACGGSSNRYDSQSDQSEGHGHQRQVGPVRQSEPDKQGQANQEEEDIRDKEHAASGLQRVHALRHTPGPDRPGGHGRQGD